MKIKQTLLFSVLFSISIFIGALHHLDHTHSKSENCMVCHIQNHSDSEDTTPELAQVVPYLHFLSPLTKHTLLSKTTFSTTLYGRAPPSFS